MTTSSKNYAGALAEIADDNIISYDGIKNDLNTVSEIIKNSPDLKSVLENITISTDIKNSIIDEVFKNQINEKIINFLKILTNKNKFGEFAEIKSDFETIYNDVNNIKLIDVTSAVELTQEQKNRVTEKLQAKLNKQIKANWLLDEGIIGGLIIKIDDNVINSSLKNRLEKLI